MSIGSVLAEARERAGLSVAEVSAQTRIRAALIRAIERDDFAACGGDFYARGHIRAIARVVGVDSLPLISEFDTVRPGVRPVTIDDLLGESAAAAPGVPTSGNVRKAEPELAEAAGPDPDPEPDPEPDSAPGSEAPGIGPEDSILNPAAFGPAAATEPAAWGPAPAEPAAWGPAPTGPAAGTYEGRRHTRPTAPRWPLLPILLAALAVIGIGVYRVSAGTGSSPSRATAASRPAPTAPPVSSHSPTAAPSPSRTPSASPSHSPSASLTTVQPRSVTAYGPGGTSDGDNPQHASQALSGNSGSPWQSQWYTTSAFGNLKSGTGLLFDLGQTVQAKEVTVGLGQTSGASFQVRAGDSVSGLRTVASVSGAGSDVHVHLSSPVSARYLVVWFTALPPNGNGTYQAAVSGLSVSAVSG